jgi:hypothetical protein
MKKYILIIITFIIVALATFFVAKDSKIFSSFKGMFLPEPTYVLFEEQRVLTDYDWSLIGPTAKAKNLIIKENKIVIVKVWSSEGEENEKDLACFNELYNDYKTKVEFVFVTRDEQVPAREFLSKNKYFFPLYFSMSTPPKPLNISFAPQTYVINKKGRIVVDYKGAANWNSKKFREMLDGLLKQ